MAHVITAVLPFPKAAKAAVAEIKSTGLDIGDISAIAKDGPDQEMIDGNFKGGSVGGTVTGGILGVLFGILSAPAALKIPGLGPMLVFGPMAVWGITGAVTGSLLGTLSASGYPPEIATEYENQIRQGGILLAVQAHHQQEQQIKDILRRHGAFSEHVLHKEIKT
jgi:hypothetical protein